MIRRSPTIARCGEKNLPSRNERPTRYPNSSSRAAKSSNPTTRSKHPHGIKVTHRHVRPQCFNAKFACRFFGPNASTVFVLLDHHAISYRPADALRYSLRSNRRLRIPIAPPDSIFEPEHPPSMIGRKTSPVDDRWRACRSSPPRGNGFIAPLACREIDTCKNPPSATTEPMFLPRFDRAAHRNLVTGFVFPNVSPLGR